MGLLRRLLRDWILPSAISKKNFISIVRKKSSFLQSLISHLPQLLCSCTYRASWIDLTSVCDIRSLLRNSNEDSSFCPITSSSRDASNTNLHNLDIGEYFQSEYRLELVLIFSRERQSRRHPPRHPRHRTAILNCRLHLLRNLRDLRDPGSHRDEKIYSPAHANSYLHHLVNHHHLYRLHS
jgi:hypothetical protein